MPQTNKMLKQVRIIYFLFLYIILLVFLGFVIFKNNFNGDISIILILILIQFITTVIEYKLTLKIIKRII